MPNTGDATGSFDPKRSAQDVYRAFQDNHVRILGLAKETIIEHEGLPPTLRIQVRLDNGKPVISDASTLPEGESLPPADSVLTVDLTQANNSIGGSSWYASGAIDDLTTGLSTATATTIPDTNWGPYALNDPDRRDEWSRLLPQSAYDAIENVKKKLAIHDGVVGRAVPIKTRKPRTRPSKRILAAAGGAVVAVAAIAGFLLFSSSGSNKDTPAPAAASQSSPAPTATSTPPTTTGAAASPVPPSVSPVVNTTVSVGGAWVHDKPGVSSTVCAMIKTSPPLPSAKVATTVSTTNGVISGPTTASGTTDASGASEAKFTITQFGSYSFAATVTAPSGATSSATGTVTVTSAAGTGCP